MSRDDPSSVSIQTEALPIPSVPAWFGEVALVAHTLSRRGLLSTLSEQVRFARKRFGTYEVIDFLVVLIGYALSGEPTLAAYYERLQPFAGPFMALFGRRQLPHRSSLSRFLSALDEAAVEALRTVFLQDALAHPGPAEGVGGLFDRQGNRWIVFDLDGTRQAARQRALPKTPDLPPPQRRLLPVCAPGYTGRERGEVVRTRTTRVLAHTHQWLGTFGGAGNGDYRGELLRGLSVIVAYQTALGLLPGQALVRLDGLYGNGAIVVDLIAAAVGWVIRGKDYGLLNLPQVKARLALPADEQLTHPESGTCRDLFDCGELPVTAEGHRSRLIVATHQASTSPVGLTRDGRVYELFFTGLPALGFTAADVVRLYLHRGSFETSLADEDREQDSDRWCSFTRHGQEIWQILSQWMWNLRQELSQQWQPTQMRLTLFAQAQTEAFSPSAHLASQPASQPPLAESSFGPPQWARAARVGSLGGEHFVLQPNGTLRCPQGATLYPQERRPEHDGTLRVLYSARLADCRACPVRTQCQGHGTSTKKPRRVSAVLHPLPPPAHEDPPAPPWLHEDHPPPCPSAPHPLLWGDWPRCQPRRAWIQWLRSHLVTVNAPAVSPPPSTPSLLSRAERAHWRLSWQQRLARNARLATALPVEIRVYGLSTGFAQMLGLPVA
jgi:hypothetical protein